MKRMQHEHTTLQEHTTSVLCVKYYRNLPNMGAGRSYKVRSDRLRQKLMVLAFQRWFGIENRTIIKETTSILAIYDGFGFLQTMGAPLLGEAPLIGRLRYVMCWSDCSTRTV